MIAKFAKFTRVIHLCIVPWHILPSAYSAANAECFVGRIPPTELPGDRRRVAPRHAKLPRHAPSLRIILHSSLQNFANFWRARSRLYQNEFLQENMCLTAFFEIYKMCTLLHRSKLNMLAIYLFEKLAISLKFSKT